MNMTHKIYNLAIINTADAKLAIIKYINKGLHILIQIMKAIFK